MAISPAARLRQRAMFLDPLARIALPTKVIGQLRGIIIRDMYHPDLDSRGSPINVTTKHEAEIRTIHFVDCDSERELSFDRRYNWRSLGLTIGYYALN